METRIYSIFSLKNSKRECFLPWNSRSFKSWISIKICGWFCWHWSKAYQMACSFKKIESSVWAEHCTMYKHRLCLSICSSVEQYMYCSPAAHIRMSLSTMIEASLFIRGGAKPIEIEYALWHASKSNFTNRTNVCQGEEIYIPFSLIWLYYDAGWVFACISVRIVQTVQSSDFDLNLWNSSCRRPSKKFLNETK